MASGKNIRFTFRPRYLEFEYSLGAFGERNLVEELKQPASTRDQLILNVRGEMIDVFAERSYKYGHVEMIGLDSDLRAYTEEDTGLHNIGQMEDNCVSEETIDATIRVPKTILPNISSILRLDTSTEFSFWCEEASNYGGVSTWLIRNMVWKGSFGKINPKIE